MRASDCFWLKLWSIPLCGTEGWVDFKLPVGLTQTLKKIYFGYTMGHMGILVSLVRDQTHALCIGSMDS